MKHHQSLAGFPRFLEDVETRISERSTGAKPFQAWIRRYTEANDDDTVEDFDTYEEAKQFVIHEMRGITCRAWINNAEVTHQFPEAL